MKKVKILYQLEKIMKQSEENNDVNKEEDEKDKMVDISLTKDSSVYYSVNFVY
jgi:hypothetical protein